MRRPEDDQDLRGFFDAMIEKDRQIPTPDYPETKIPKTIHWWIPAGIAASMALGFFLFGDKEPPAPPQPPIGEVILITLEEGPDQELRFHIEETTEMDIWESPTASLLTEY